MARRPLIVLPVDFSVGTETTVAYVFGLARQHGADVALLHILTPATPAHLELADARGLGYVADHANWSRLTELVRSVQSEGVRVRMVTQRGEAKKVIPAYAQLNTAALIVIGRDYGTSRLWRNAAVASSLGRSAPSPVLVVPPGYTGSETGTPAPFVEIVSAVNFTVASAVALRAALDLAQRNDARITLLHVVEDVPRHMVFSGGEALRVVRDVASQAAEIEERLRRKVPIEAIGRVAPRVITGIPHRGILQVASLVKADLIVMGVAPRGILDQVFLGSTLRKVLRRATSPVLVLPVVAGAHEWLENGGLDGSNAVRGGELRPYQRPIAA